MIEQGRPVRAKAISFSARMVEAIVHWGLPMEFQAPLDLPESQAGWSLPLEHESRRPAHFGVDRIFLAKGGLATQKRRIFVEHICRLCPDAELVECQDTQHNRVDLGEPDALSRHKKGKHTLVFGELGDSVRFISEEGNNPCP